MFVILPLLYDFSVTMVTQELQLRPLLMDPGNPVSNQHRPLQQHPRRTRPLPQPKMLLQPRVSYSFIQSLIYICMFNWLRLYLIFCFFIIFFLFFTTLIQVSCTQICYLEMRLEIITKKKKREVVYSVISWPAWGKTWKIRWKNILCFRFLVTQHIFYQFWTNFSFYGKCMTFSSKLMMWWFQQVLML